MAKGDLDLLRKKKYRDYAWYLYLIASDETGSLKDWGNRLVRQLQKDDSEGFANTDAWIARTWDRTKFAQKFNAGEEAGRIEEAQGQTPQYEADYAKALERTQTYIRDQAERMGVQIDDATIAELARQARLASMPDNEIDRLLRPFLTDSLESGADLTGVAGDYQTQLSQWVSRNGIELDAGTVAKYIENMTLQNQSLNDVKQEIRMTYLLGAFPAWSDRIEAGYDPEQIVSPYRSSAAKLLEMDPDQLGFDDPLIKMSMQSTGPDGKPKVLPLYEFEQKVREDPRWQYTDNAYASYTRVGQDLLRMFGLR